MTNWRDPLLYEEFRARFEPVDQDLKPGAEAWIGRELVWRRQWLIDPDEDARYGGQYACSPTNEELDRLHALNDLPPFVWVPESDLAKIGEPEPLKSLGHGWSPKP